MSRWSVCTVVAVVSAVALSGCGESQADIQQKVIEAAVNKCRIEERKVLDMLNGYPTISAKDAAITSEDKASGTYEVTLPLWANALGKAERVICTAKVKGDQVDVTLR